MIFFIILGLYLIIFFNYSDLFFYRYGIDAILIIILAVIILIYQILKNNIPFRKEFSLWTLFFVIELIINYFNSYYFYDSLVYVILLVSLCIICNYIFNLDSKNNHKILISIVIIGLINLIFSIIELTCKFFGYKDIFLLNNSLYIGTKNYIGGLLYLPSFNALLLNTTAFLMLFYINKINNKLTLVGSKIIILLMLFMSIYTGSRSSFIAMIFATILFIFFSHKYKINNEVKNNFYIFFTTYFIIIVLTIFIPNLFLNYGTNPINKFYNAGTDPSIYSRLNIWHAQLLMFLAKHLFGWGMESFKYLVNV
jgi:O-antigen ligase